MAIIGILLILAAGVVTAGALYNGGTAATFEVFGLSTETTMGGVFVIGLATMLVFVLGVWLLLSAAGRGRRKRAERKAAREHQKQSVSQIEEERARLKAENERLAQQLARREAVPTHPGGGTAATPTGAAPTGATAAEATHGGSPELATAPAQAGAGHAADSRPQHVEGDRVDRVDSSGTPGGQPSDHREQT